MNNTEPVKSIEWLLTYRCNYNCEYCNQDKSKHSDETTVKNSLKLIDNLDGIWYIKLIGGEPFIHPDFFKIADRITNAGHTLFVTTNFSTEENKLKEFSDICSGQLKCLTASLHLSQVKNLNEFIRKAINFNRFKHKETEFTVTSVLTEKNFDKLKKIREELSSNGVDFRFQRLRIFKDSGVQIAKYTDEIENYAKGHFIRNSEKILSINSRGIICNSGYKFFRIMYNGDMLRCYNAHPRYFKLGNVNGKFKLLDGPKPCLASQCTCTVPVNRNMLCFNRTGKISMSDQLSYIPFNIKQKLYKLYNKIR